MEAVAESTMINRYPFYKDSGAEWLGEVPEHWETLKSKFLWEEVIELSSEGKEQLSSVSQYTGVTRNEKDTRSESLIGYNKVKKNELVINIMLAWLGGLGVSSLSGIVSPAYSVYKLIKEADVRFLHYLYRNPIYLSEFARRSKGVVPSRWRMYTEDFGQVITLLPPVEEQTAIAEFLDYKTGQIEKAIAQKKRQIELLKERRQALIQRAVTRGLNPEAPMKDSGVEWIGEIPAHWEVKSLKHLGKFVNGFAFDSDKFKEVGIRVMKIANIQPMQLDWTEESYVDESYYTNLMKFRVEKNDVVFALTRPIIESGIKMAIVDSNDKILLNQRNALLKPFDGLNRKWFYYVSLTSSFMQTFDNEIDKTGQQPNISTISIGNIKIPLPNGDIQAEIITFLDSLTIKIDSIISLKEREIEKLREYKASLIDAAVRGKIKV